MSDTTTKARLTALTPELDETIIQRLSDGETLTSICRDLGLRPNAVYKWTMRDPDFGQRFARAREFGDLMIEDQAIDLSDARVVEDETTETSGDKGTSFTKTRRDNVARSRLQAEMRLKVVARRKGARITNEIKFMKRTDAEAAAEMTTEQLLEIARMRAGDEE